MHTLSPRRKVYDRTLRGLLYLCAGITCALLVFLIGYIFYRGLGNLSWELLTTQTSYSTPSTSSSWPWSSSCPWGWVRPSI